MKNLSRVGFSSSLLIIFSVSLFIPSCLAANPSLLIVQVQIAGEKTDNDFIKIYNPLDVDLDISGYKLRKRSSTGGESSIRVFPEGKIIATKSYFIWANSKEGYADLIGANEKSTATLAKNNSIALFNAAGEILDALAWGESQNPFIEGQTLTENPTSNQKLERKKTDEAYQDTNNNSEDFYLNPPFQPPPPAQEQTPPPEPSPTPEASPATETPPTAQTLPTPPPLSTTTSTSYSPSLPSAQTSSPASFYNPEIKKQKPTYPPGIFINEILPSPEGSDEQDEWIEIFNQNSFEVDLSTWRIKDSNGAITAFTIPSGTKILSFSFLVFPRPTTKITLNNEGDGISLLQPDGNILETINYPKAPLGQSWSRTGSGWFWTANLTPGAKNIISEPAAQIETTESPETVLTQDNSLSQKQLAAVGGQMTKKNYFIILIAIAIAVFSAIIILFLKTKLKTE